MIKKGDFVEIEYTAKVKEDGFIFDTTDEAVAKKNNIHHAQATYGPIALCVGKNHVLKGLDNALEGKEVNKEYTVTLKPEEAFGKKSAQLLKLVPLSVFKKGNIDPQPGVQVNFGDQMGIIKTVSGGRIVVDFNHPLASKELEYTFTIKKQITDETEKVRIMVAMTMGLKKDVVDVSIKDKKATVETLKVPEQLQEHFSKHIIESVPTIKELVFKEKKSLNTRK